MIYMNKYRITNPNNKEVRDCKSRTTKNLLVSNEEIEKINSSIKNLNLNLSQYNVLWDDGYRSNDTAKSMINFYYKEYDLSKLVPYEYLLRHYDSISNSLRNK